MDTAVAIRTLEATYKSSADAAAVETIILKLTEKVKSLLTINININMLYTVKRQQYVEIISECIRT